MGKIALALMGSCQRRARAAVSYLQNGQVWQAGEGAYAPADRKQEDPVATLAPGTDAAAVAGGSEEAGWGRLYKPQNAVLRSSDLPAGNWKTSDDFVKMVAWCINFVTLLSVDQSTGTS